MFKYILSISSSKKLRAASAAKYSANNDANKLKYLLIRSIRSPLLFKKKILPHRLIFHIVQYFKRFVNFQL